MAVEAYRNFLSGISVPPGKTLYFSWGPSPVWGRGAINVTCHVPVPATALVADFVEVIQMAVRRQSITGGSEFLLDIVVRNNGGSASNYHGAYIVYGSTAF